MGLDMWLEGIDNGVRIGQLGYWRKHPDLHGFIVKEFAAGVDECQPIPLTVHQLQLMLVATMQDRLPETTGFFFGVSTGEDKQSTIDILTEAIRWVNESPFQREVFYQASW